jgi:chitinase
MMASKRAESASNNQYVRGCYFTNWSQYRNGLGKFTPERYQPGLCTHLMYAFLTFGEDFVVKPFEWNDESTEWSKGQMEKVNDLKKIDPNLKTLASIGGWNFGGRLFALMSSTSANRAKFISSLIPYIRKWGFDGFDVDWEYPSNEVEKANYVLLLKDLKAAFIEEARSTGRAQLLLTAALAAGDEKIKTGFNIPEIAKYLDYAFLMTYDFHGAWESGTGLNSPLYGRPNQPAVFKNFNTDAAMKIWLNGGMPKEKLILGIATYGRGWTLSKAATDFGIGAATSGPAKATQFVNDAGTAAYYELCTMQKNGAKRYWDAQQQAPYLVFNDQWFGFDDAESVRNKMQYVKSNGFGGAFVWTLDFDDFTGMCGTPFPLIGIIRDELSGAGVTRVTSTTSTPRSTTSTTTRSTTPTRTTTTSTAIPPRTSSTTTTTIPPRTSTTTNASSTSSTTTTTTTTPASSSSSTSSSASSSITTTSASAPGEFSCPGDGLFRDPSSCSKFIKCSGGVPYYFDCPSGLMFSDKSLVCDWPQNVQCGKK